jgi:hypothetical protein
LIVLGVTVWFVVIGSKHPIPDKSIAIALLSAIGTPIALSLMVAGYQKFRGPGTEELKTEAEAKKRAA